MRHKKTIAAVISIVMISCILLAFDIDADGILTYLELTTTHTNPFNPDSDSDGLNDGQEIRHGTNPLVSDTDGDGLTDGAEILKYNTNPLKSDSDGDKVTDSKEISLGINPLNPDSDGDGLYDAEPFPLDATRPSLTLKVTNIDLVRNDNTALLIIKYDILADGSLTDDSLIYKSDVVQNRLDWSNFHLLINGLETQVSRGFREVSCYIRQESSNIEVQYNENSQPVKISKQLLASHVNYTFSEISDYWNTHTMPSQSSEGSSYDSMQQAFDEYATIYSGLVLMRDHIGQLKSKFTSIDNWYLWLSNTFNGATSVDSAWNNFQEYAQSSGMKDLVTNVWTELNALTKSIPQLRTIITEHPQSILKAAKRMVTNSVSSPGNLIYTLDTLESSSSGSSIEKAIDALTYGIQSVYAQLGSDFFGWVKSNSPIENDVSAADGGQFYLDNMQEITSLKNYYGVSFPQIIETNLQYVSAGGRGVAWWPVQYSYFIYGSDIKFPFHLDSSCSTSFPLSEVHFIYKLGPDSGKEKVFKVFLATESIVENYLKKNGFIVTCLPPAENQNASLPQARQISLFFNEKLKGDIYLSDPSLSGEISWLSNCFSSFQSTGLALAVLEKYGSAQNFLEELNQNTLQLTLV